MSLATVQSTISIIQTSANTAAGIVSQLDPAVALDAQTAAALVTVLAELATAATNALAAASQTAITPASIEALAPDETPLVPAVS